MTSQMVLLPRVSEKSYALNKSHNTYVFDVPSDATKQSVAAAVEQQFRVSVVDVNMVVAKGKRKRALIKGGRPKYGRRKDVKRAYVRIKADDHIPVFAAIDEAEKKASKRENK
jgi:large subunit ribosomal protein L23